MATTPGIIRTIIILFPDNSNIDRRSIINNRVFRDSVTNGITDAIAVSVRELHILPSGGGFTHFSFKAVIQVDIITDAAGDAQIVAALPTLHTQLGLNDPVRSWSYQVIFGF